MSIEEYVSRKIALVGTSCVGKTTLLDYYERRFVGDPQFAAVKEAARAYFTQNPQIPLEERFGYGPQSAIQDLAMENERRAQASGARTILTDRSVFDAPAYVRGEGDIKGSERLLSRVHHWIPTYHTIFLLDPVDVPYIQDDIRQEDPTVRLRNHEAFLELFKIAQIRYDLLSGTFEGRVKKINEVIVFQR